jgi:hypothetical protein
MTSGAPITESENYKLLYAMISRMEIPKLDWDAIANELGIKPKTARQRWGNIQKQQMGRVIRGPYKKREGAVSAGLKKAPGKAAKRKAADMNSDEAEAEDDDGGEGEVSGGDAKDKESDWAGKKPKRENESEDGFGSQEYYGGDDGEHMEGGFDSNELYGGGDDEHMVDGSEGFKTKQEEQQAFGGKDDYAVQEYRQYYDGYPDK